MAATNKLPSTEPDVILNTTSLLLGTGPIAKITESVPTSEVDIDIKSSTIQAVLPSHKVELEVEAPERIIDKALGTMIGGDQFIYWLLPQRDVRDRFDLIIEANRPFLINVEAFGQELQSKDPRITVFANGALINLDPRDVLAALF